ncbi:hypothetical protein [Nonomuraea sp. NPDC048826]|uniref:hypothetical protein n=1 Tax=Nonomuraea sp. NPDC048826 TaxID=3364347 RepID=UPI003716A807
MADHDRDAGSRGGQEPRDPSRRETEILSSGPFRDGRTAAHPTPYDDYGPGPYAGPGWDPLPPPPTRSDFHRRRSTQIIGAGIVGLVAGAFIGGGAVALAGDLWNRPEPSASWNPPQRDQYRGPERLNGRSCYLTEGRITCDLAPAPTHTG